MNTTLLIAIITCLCIVLSVLFLPKITIGKISIDTYWLIALLGAIFTIIFSALDIGQVIAKLTEDTSINPIKILVLFISMTIISIYLDEVGFFRYLASVTLKRAGKSQKKLFVILYITVSLLTIFTSNDIIVLTFTPFICYFARNAKIKAMPYLFAEFVAANTMSMTLIIGNPTNIYLATAYSVSFVDYFLVMVLPTLMSSIVAFGILYLIFAKSLREDISCDTEIVEVGNKPYLVVGLVHLLVCIVALAVGPYVGIDMWLVSLVCAISLFVITGIVSIVTKRSIVVIGKTLVRAPWQLIPFVLSMFVVILGLSSSGFTEIFANALGEDNVIIKYGVVSTISANILNNIPMSVLFSAICSNVNSAVTLKAVYATIIGSNIGAFLTPIGALAGIMWSSMLKTYHIKFSFLDFIKYGVIVAVPTLFTALGVLWLII